MLNTRKGKTDNRITKYSKTNLCSFQKIVVALTEMYGRRHKNPAEKKKRVQVKKNYDETSFKKMLLRFQSVSFSLIALWKELY